MVQIHSPRPLLLEPTTYSTEKCRRHPGCGPTSGCFKCAGPSTSMSFSKLELSGVTLRRRFPHFVAHVAQTGRPASRRGFNFRIAKTGTWLPLAQDRSASSSFATKAWLLLPSSVPRSFISPLLHRKAWTIGKPELSNLPVSEKPATSPELVTQMVTLLAPPRVPRSVTV
jgi:hypothetical protein